MKPGETAVVTALRITGNTSGKELRPMEASAARRSVTTSDHPLEGAVAVAIERGNARMRGVLATRVAEWEALPQGETAGDHAPGESVPIEGHARPTPSAVFR